MKRIVTLLIAFLLFLSSYTYAATCTWTGFGDWHIAANWSCGHVPTLADDAVIPSFTFITANAPVQVNNLTISTGGNFTFNANVVFLGNTTVSGPLATNITLTGGGTNQGVLALNSFNSTFKILNADFTNQGTISIGSTFVTITNQGTIFPAKLINTGNFKVEYDDASPLCFLNIPCINNGTFSMEVKPLTLGRCALNTLQPFTNNGTISLAGNLNTLNIGLSFTHNASGTMNLTKGIVTFGGLTTVTLNKDINLSNTATLVNAGATIQGSGGNAINVGLGGVLELIDGVTGVYINIDVGGKLILKPLSSGPRTLSRDIVNNGEVFAQGSPTNLAGLFTNNGFFYITGSFSDFTGIGAIANEGTIRCSGIATIGVRTTNSSTKTIEVSGELRLNSYDNWGNLTVSPGSTLQLGGSNVLHNLRSSSNITGTGTLAFDLGNHQIDYALTPTSPVVNFRNGAYLSGSGSLTIANSSQLNWLQGWTTIPLTINGTGTMFSNQPTFSNTVTLNGTLTWSGGTPLLATNGNLVIASTGVFNMNSAGVIDVASGGTNVGIQNCGQIITTQNASINVPLTSCNTAILKGANILTFSPPLAASGIIQPNGSSIGTMRLNPSISTTSDAKFELQVSSTTADKITSAGNIALNGKIRLILNSPALGVLYTLFSSTSGTISGYNIGLVEYSTDGGANYTAGLPIGTTITNDGTSLVFSVDPPDPSGNVITWLGGTGNWSTPAKWDLNRVPLVTDNVIINSGNVYKDHTTTVASITTLTVTGGAILQARNLVVSGVFNCTDCYLQNAYGMVVNGLTTINTSLTIDDGDLTLNGGGVSNSANIDVVNTFTNGSKLILPATKTLTLNANTNCGLSYYGGGYVQFDGNVVKNGNAIYVLCADRVLGAGNIDVNAGRFVFDCASTFGGSPPMTGAYTVASGATFELSRQIAVASPATFTGAGNYEVTSQLTLNSNITFPKLAIIGTAVNGTGNLTVTGNLELVDAGIISTTGTATVNGNLTTSGSSTCELRAGGDITVNGTSTLDNISIFTNRKLILKGGGNLTSNFYLSGKLAFDGGTYAVDNANFSSSGEVILKSGNVNFGASPNRMTSQLNIQGGVFDNNSMGGLGALFPQKLTVSGGVYKGTGAVIIDGQFHWSGGTISGSGLLIPTSTSFFSGSKTLIDKTIEIAPDGGSLGTGSLHLCNGATLRVPVGASLNTSLYGQTMTIDDGGCGGTGNGVLDIKGDLGVYGTSPLTLTNVMLTNTGTITNNGIINCNTGVTNSGMLKGTGFYNFTLNNEGETNPGNSPGTMTVSGAITSQPTAVYNMEITGFYGDPGTFDDADKLVGGSTMTLGGTLNIILYNAQGGSYTLIDAVSTTGSFSTIQYSLNGGPLTTTAPIGTSLAFDPAQGTVILTLAVALSAELTTFKGQITDNGNLLTWQSASEVNLDNYDVERSTDGQHFDKIGTVKAQGKSATYDFLDKGGPLSITTYYRLKINDLDQKSAYSKVITLAPKAKGLTAKAYPNPAHDVLTVDIEVEKKSDLTIELRDILGRLVWASNALYTEGSLSLPIPLTGVANGNYFLKVSNGLTTIQQKIVKN
jgi:fibronectin-binding autotransporter adhesin